MNRRKKWKKKEEIDNKRSFYSFHTYERIMETAWRHPPLTLLPFRAYHSNSRPGVLSSLARASNKKRDYLLLSSSHLDFNFCYQWCCSNYHKLNNFKLLYITTINYTSTSYATGSTDCARDESVFNLWKNRFLFFFSFFKIHLFQFGELRSCNTTLRN